MRSFGALIGFVIQVAMVLALAGPAAAEVRIDGPTPIVIGQSFRLDSAVMGGSREINVYLPAGYAQGETRYPVLFLLDGGQDQDFHHISGLAQLGPLGGSSRELIVVGVATRDRRNELTHPTDEADLMRDFPTAGGSERFRRFLAQEVLPFVKGRFRTEGPSTLIGESLAGLFVVETFLKQPDLFDAYVASSPSLWWDGGSLASEAESLLSRHPSEPHVLILTLANEGGEMQAGMDRLTAALRTAAPAGLDWRYDPRPDQTPGTLFHRAALEAVRPLYPAAPP